ncbi:PfkB family carbohydrate kinase [Haloplanus halophilus]|uniref:PfkB family carbohydrate kinase n=1 Tax=Haloplanus halophilus TaxID=2949993 RepID=UPI00203CCA55|nr:PfkB family carbohydrate kinase [Haloplanus sp. GDY1]
MPYADLVTRLRAGLEPVTVGAFPDGSVDDYYRLRDGESTLASRAAFAAAVSEGRDSFGLDHVTTDAGGQAVNAARQAAALGDDVTLVGHLDHPVFDFDFETASMGSPARVRVCLFDADDVMFVEESADLAAWTFADLRAALGEPIDAFLERDALCCTNWASTPGLGAAMRDVGARDPDGGVCCVDPGPLTTAGARDLLAALPALGDAYDLVLSVNDAEAARLAEAVGDGAGGEPTDPAALDAVRTAAGAAGVVVHGVEDAVAATTGGRVSVPTLDVSRALTETGAGDRFSAGLARSLAAGWDWPLAVAAGNACASHYVSGQGTATPASLAAHVSTHGPPA